MDIDRIRYFKTIVETGSLKQASELLNISGPALSKAIKVLESEIQQKLLVQDGRGVTVTKQGMKFYTEALKLLKDYDALKARMLNANAAEKKLRIGSFELFLTHFIGPLMRDYFPDFSLFLPGYIPGELEEALVAELIDIGITNIPVPKPQIEFLKVTDYRVGLYSRKDCQFRKNDFSDIPFVAPITLVEGSPARVRGLDSWPDDSVPRKIVYGVTLMESGLEICRQGLAAAYLPNFVVRLHNESVKESYRLTPMTLPEGVPADHSVYIAKRKADIEGPEMKRLAKALRKLCSD